MNHHARDEGRNAIGGADVLKLEDLPIPEPREDGWS
jgi:hypothetical protein